MKRFPPIQRLRSSLARANLAKWLEPNQPDPILARQQRLLNLVLLGLALPGALFGLVMLVFWILGAVPPTGAIAGLGVQPFYILAYVLGRRGRVTLAAYIPVGAVFLAMLGGGLQLGIGHVTYIGFAMVTLTASILINIRAGLAIAILSTLSNLLIGTLQLQGQLPTALDPLSTVLADSIGLGLGLAVLIVFTGIYGNELTQALLLQQALSAELHVRGANLERDIRRRTRLLERRAIQIRTAAEISRSISALLQPRPLLQQVVELVGERFGLYYVGVFLLDSEGEWAVLQAGTGLAGQKMLAEGHKLSVGGASMIGWATFQHKARIALDVGQEAVRFNNPHLPETRSELALPLLRRIAEGESCLGALTVQSVDEGAFDEEDITVLQTIADSLAIALENAQLYQETQASLEEIRSLHRQYLSLAWSQAPGLADDGQDSTGKSFTYTYEGRGRGGPAVEFPLTLRGQAIGSLTVEGVSGIGDLSAEDRGLIEAIATETSIALENARLLEENQRRARQERLIGDVAAKVQSSLDLNTLLKGAVREIALATRAARVQIRLLEPEAAEPQPRQYSPETQQGGMGA
jgi:GAF domain-containing protein